MPRARPYPCKYACGTASRRRINRFAGCALVRIDRDELDVPVVVEHELAERRQFADLPARLIQRKGTVERLELAGEGEHGAAQLHLIEAGCNRQRLLEHEPGGVASHRVEAELDLAVGVLLVPGSLVRLH